MLVVQLVFLEACKQKGWDCDGLELNPSAAEFGEKEVLIFMNKIY